MSNHYSLSGSLRPVMPTNTRRYDQIKKYQRRTAVIEPGMFLYSMEAPPAYLPQQWSTFVHPEGQVYFHRSGSLGVVTESYMYDMAVGEKICAWVASIEEEAVNKGFYFPDTVELFLKLDGEDCNYYFVDRDTKTLFWLEACNTDAIGLNDAVSTSHLKLILEAQFWTHIENFCMHFEGLPRKDIDDLILVFSHALGDTLTSSLSTFPYDADACERFLNLLAASRDKIHEGHTVCYVARLWCVVVYNRYETYYGQEQSHLSRDASILVHKYQGPQWIESLISGITLQTSVPYAKRLNELFIGSVVYEDDWNDFMTTTVKEWWMAAAQSVVLLLLQNACFFLPIFPPIFYTSTSFVILSIVTSCFLIYKHQPLLEPGSGSAHKYLSTLRSPHIKFQGVAFAYALPKTFFFFSSLSQAAYVLCYYTSPHVMLLSGAILGCIVLIAHLATMHDDPGSPAAPNGTGTAN